MSRLRTKRGRYGASKLKAFTVLETAKPDYFSTRALCILTGIKYYSLARHLARWCGYRYVKRSVCTEFGEGDYQYAIARSGEDWLELAINDLPNATLFLKELNDWNKFIEPSYKELMALPFKQFTHKLDELIESTKGNNIIINNSAYI